MTVQEIMEEIDRRLEMYGQEQMQAIAKEDKAWYRTKRFELANLRKWIENDGGYKEGA